MSDGPRSTVAPHRPVVSSAIFVDSSINPGHTDGALRPSKTVHFSSNSDDVIGKFRFVPLVSNVADKHYIVPVVVRSRATSVSSTSSINSLFDEPDAPLVACSLALPANTGSLSIMMTAAQHVQPPSPTPVSPERQPSYVTVPLIAIDLPHFDRNFSGLTTKRFIARRCGYLDPSTDFVEVAPLQATAIVSVISAIRNIYSY